MARQTKLKANEVRMEDINTLANKFVDILAKQVRITEDEKEKLFVYFVGGLEDYFRYPDYRSHN